MFTSFNNADLNEVRTSYRIAVQDKKVCEKMIRVLEQSKEKSAVHIAYLGGYQTIWANHVFNPMEKPTTFNKGKENGISS